METTQNKKRAAKKAPKRKKSEKATDEIKERAKARVQEVVEEAKRSAEEDSESDFDLEDDVDDSPLDPDEDGTADAVDKLFSHRKGERFLDEEDYDKALNFTPPKLQQLSEEDSKDAMIDIFEHGVAFCTRIGEFPKFKIQKNGEYIGEKRGPYSFERLQREYGGGQYKIWAYTGSGTKGSSTGGYIRSQTIVISDLPHKEESESESELKSHGDTKTLVETIKELIKSDRQASVDEIRARGENKTSEMSMMMQMMQNMQQNNALLIQSLSKNTDSKFELMLQAIAQNQNKKDEIGMKEMLTLITSAKDSGAAEMTKFYKMAKELASEMRKDSDDDDDERTPSTTDALIQSLPGIVAAWTNSSRQPALAIQQQPQQIAQPIIRRPMQTPMGVGAQVAGQPRIQPQEGQPIMKPRPTVQPPLTIHPAKGERAEAPKKQEAVTLKLDLEDKESVDDQDGKTEVSEDVKLQPGERYEKPITDAVLDTKSVDRAEVVALNEKELRGEFSEASSGTYENDDEGDYVRDPKNPEAAASYVEPGKNFPLQDAMLGLVQETLISGFLTGEKAQKTAEKAFNKFKVHGIASDDVLKAFPDEGSIIDVALMKGVPKQALSKLREFYANLSSLLKDDATRVHGKSPQ